MTTTPKLKGLGTKPFPSLTTKVSDTPTRWGCRIFPPRFLAKPLDTSVAKAYGIHMTTKQVTHEVNGQSITIGIGTTFMAPSHGTEGEPVEWTVSGLQGCANLHKGLRVVNARCAAGYAIAFDLRTVVEAVQPR